MSDASEPGQRGWDIIVRLTHWGTASAVLLNATLLSEAGEIHMALGYAVAGFLAVRLIWGLIGPRPARLTSFWPSHRKTRAHLAALTRGTHPRYPSHNPLGAWVIFAFWITLTALIGSGIAIGPMGLGGFDDLHEGLSAFVLFLAFLHLAGVLFERLAGDGDVLRRMIRGRERD